MYKIRNISYNSDCSLWTNANNVQTEKNKSGYANIQPAVHLQNASKFESWPRQLKATGQY